jgi:prolipoprotein diacylglyceryl transferase
MLMPSLRPLSIPSPSQGSWQIGPFPLRAYALAIILGVVVAIWLGERRWQARGGKSGVVGDVAIVAVPLGIVGGRLYHVITDWELYFSHDSWHPWQAFKVWQGGLGIWGAIALGTLGAWIALRRRGVPLGPWLDAVAPGVAFAQAIGRWGNYFNQELYGKPTSLPWALHITKGDNPGYYHPTFLYESLWCIGVGLLVIWADRRFRLGGGRAFWLYVAAYTVGRAWIEWLRVDPAHRFLGLRLNDYVSAAVFALAAVMLYLLRDRHSDDPGELGAGGAPSGEAASGEASTGEAAIGEASTGDEPAGHEPVTGPVTGPDESTSVASD